VEGKKYLFGFRRGFSIGSYLIWCNIWANFDLKIYNIWANFDLKIYQNSCKLIKVSFPFEFPQNPGHKPYLKILKISRPFEIQNMCKNQAKVNKYEGVFAILASLSNLRQI
jgi:hypothetical protein